GASPMGPRSSSGSSNNTTDARANAMANTMTGIQVYMPGHPKQPVSVGAAEEIRFTTPSGQQVRMVVDSKGRVRLYRAQAGEVGRGTVDHEYGPNGYIRIL